VLGQGIYIKKRGEKEMMARLIRFVCVVGSPHELSWELTKVTKFQNFPSK
jgi:hypothetical protein